MKRLGVAIACLSAGISLHAQSLDFTLDEYQYGFFVSFNVTGSAPNAQYFLDSFQVGGSSYSLHNLPGTDLSSFPFLAIGAHVAKVKFDGGELDASYTVDHIPDQLPDFSQGISFLGDLISSTTTSSAPVSSPDTGATVLLLSLSLPLLQNFRRIARAGM